MTPSENRRFWAILGLSAAFHAALFAMLAVPRKPAALPTIIASIRLIEASVSAAPATSVVATAAVPATLRPDATRAAKRATSRSGRLVGPSDVPLAGTAVAAPAAQEATVPAVPTPVAEAPRQAAPVAAVATQSDMLATYRQRLTELFARGYEYPRIAALRGWEGEVRLRLKVARKGNLLGIQLDRSSGFEVLDQHALAMLESHGNLPPLPDSLEGSEIQVIVPINYRLRKTT